MRGRSSIRAFLELLITTEGAMTTCEQAAIGILAGKNATSVLEKMVLQSNVDHATNCGCDTCRPALRQFYGDLPIRDLTEVT